MLSAITLTNLIMSPLATASFCLFQVPGLPKSKIPGLSDVYMPTAAAEKAMELFQNVNKAALILLPLLLLIAGGMAVVGLGEQWTLPDVLKRIVATMLLLVGIQFIYGGVMAIGVGLGEKILKSDDVQKINQQFEEIAKKKQDEKVDEDKATGFLERAGLFLSAFNLDTMMNLVTGLTTLLFFVATVVMTSLWRVLAIILFVISPLTIVLGVVPGIGTRITANWFGALIQISFWQVWFSICAWFVENADSVFTVSDTTSRSSVANHVESTAYAVIFFILYIATPFIVSALVPLSLFSSVGVTSLISVSSLIFNNASKLIGK